MLFLLAIVNVLNFALRLFVLLVELTGLFGSKGCECYERGGNESQKWLKGDKNYYDST